MDIYKKKGIILISVCEKDTYDIETSLDKNRTKNIFVKVKLTNKCRVQR